MQRRMTGAISPQLADATPVLDSEEDTALPTGMDLSGVVGLRDYALIAVMTYSFAPPVPSMITTRGKSADGSACARKTAHGAAEPI